MVETCDLCSALKPTIHADLNFSLELRTTSAKIDLAALRGCLFCYIVSILSRRYLSHICSRVRGDAKQLERRGELIGLSRNWDPGEQTEDLRGSGRVTATHGRQGKVQKGIFVRFPYIYSVLPDGQDESLYMRRFEICATDGVGSPFPALNGITLASEDPMSEILFDNITRWHKICLETHPRCGRNSCKDLPLPSRVLDLEGLASGSHLRLVETAGANSIYVALSYCWGQGQTLKTTTDNIEDHKDQIVLEALPATVHDAIKVTKRLGVRYLWVDALCIIQDDKQDWEKEAANMFAVYGNALFVIAAVSTPSSDAGFLRPRNLKGTSAQCVYRDSRNTHFQVVAKGADDHSSTHSDLEAATHSQKHGSYGTHSPLWTRAWAFQERYASKAVIQFCETETIWECREATFCECGGLEKPVPEARNAAFNQGLTKIDYSREMIYASHEERQELWEKLVTTYDNLELTKLTDKFLAISAIVEQVRHPSLGTYLWGIWSEFFIDGLCWSGGSIKRPGIPTWSWASGSGSGRYYALRSCRHKCASVLPNQIFPEFSAALQSDHPAPVTIVGAALPGRIVRRPTEEELEGLNPRDKALALYFWVPIQLAQPFHRDPKPTQKYLFSEAGMLDIAKEGLIGTEVKVLRLAYVETDETFDLPTMDHVSPDHPDFEALRDKQNLYIVLIKSKTHPTAWERIASVGTRSTRGRYWPNLMQHGEFTIV